MNLRSISEPQQPRVEVRRSVRRRRTVTAYRERDAIVVLIPSPCRGRTSGGSSMIWCGRSWLANPAYRLRAEIQNWQSVPAHWLTGI